MTFLAYCGDFGSGKTANMVESLYRAQSKNTIIIANFSLTFGDIILQDLDEFINFLLFIYQEKTQNTQLLKGKRIIIAIDEAQIWFTSRGWKGFPEALTDFICQLRKMNTSIYITVQRPYMLEKNFRTFVEFWLWHKRPLSLFDKQLPNSDSKVPRFFNRCGFYRMYELDAENPVISDIQGKKPKPYFYILKNRTHTFYNSLEMVRKKLDNTNPHISEDWARIIRAKEDLVLPTPSPFLPEKPLAQHFAIRSIRS